MPHLPPAADLLAALRAGGETLVLAESCTGGLAAAAVVANAGASDVFAGSLVTYQTRRKTDWLGVPADLIDRHGVVSEQVAAAMAAAALARAPGATLAAAITGHLGPHAPADLDGVAWIATARRDEEPATRRVRLEPGSRGDRQFAAAAALLDAVRAAVGR